MEPLLLLNGLGINVSCLQIIRDKSEFLGTIFRCWVRNNTKEYNAQNSVFGTSTETLHLKHLSALSSWIPFRVLFRRLNVSKTDLRAIT